MSIATLNGFLIIATGSIAWSLTPGTRPYMAGFELPRAWAEEVGADSGGVASLVLGGGGASQTFDGLRVVRVEAGTRPETAIVVVADSRILWERIHVVRAYNVRKRTGTRRAFSSDPTLPELAVLADDVWYRRETLNNASGSIWLAREILEDLMRAVTGYDVRVPAGLGNYVLEDAQYDATGAEAIAMCLSEIGGLDVTVDPSGAPRLVARNGGGEGAILDAAGPRMYGRGDAALSTRRWYRPSAIRVLFDRDVEVRLDFASTASAPLPQTGSRDVPSPRLPTTLENVIQIPEPSITVAGRTARQGEYVRIDDYLSALDGLQPSGMPPITDEFLRKNFAIREYLEQLYSFEGDPLWERRYAAIWRHWRQTFRIVGDDVWLFQNWRPVLSTVVDTETGTRAASPLFGAYTRKPRLFGIYRLTSHKLEMGWSIGAWAESLGSAKLAPARVKVVDSELGIIRVSGASDIYGYTEETLPGELEVLPQQAPRKGDGSAALVSWYAAKLATPWKFATIITGQLAAPPTEDRCASILVTAQQLGVEQADGPPMVVRASADLTVARYRYQDETAVPRYLSESALVNVEELTAIAQAEARRIYHRMADRVEGVFSTAFVPGAIVDGSISAIVHRIAPNGEASTTIGLAPELDQPSIWHYLPPRVQELTRRLAQP